MASNPEIAVAAEDWMRQNGHVSHDIIDCSHFVIAVLKASVAPGIGYMRADDFSRSRAFSVVDKPERGDLVHWPGHIAIILDPVAGTFIGSQNSSGVDVASYKTGAYWPSRGSRTYLRFQH